MLLLSCVLLLAAHGLNQLRRRAQRRHRATLLQLDRQQERYRSLVENLHVVSWEMSFPSLRFTYVSPHAVDLLGLPASDWLEPGFLVSQLHPQDNARVQEQLR